MKIPRVLFALLVLSGTAILPISMVRAADWSDPGFPTDSGTTCIEGAAGITGMQVLSTSYGSGDSWRWTGISGDENNFSLTIDYVDGGSPFDSGIYFLLSVAFLNSGDTCARSFNPNFYDWPPYPGNAPPATRFVATDVCTPTVTGSVGSSTGTVQFEDMAVDRPEFQFLTLSLAPQTSAGTYTYTIDFACVASDGSGSDGPRLDWEYYVTRAAHDVVGGLPNTL